VWILRASSAWVRPASSRRALRITLLGFTGVTAQDIGIS
jgi:hypothetical protein